MNPRIPLIAAALCACAGLAHAQYKVVGPDGRITYTDRPPVGAPGQVTSLGRTVVAPAGGGDPNLPLELRQTASRWPVMLYANANCAPCDSGRQLLQQRGIPYAERRVASEDDAAALERLSGGRTIPTLTIGTQALRGFNPGDWAAYLDAAGYPRESRLPKGWQPPAVTPLVAREAAASAPAAQAATLSP